jgi:hypothetical protein
MKKKLVQTQAEGFNIHIEIPSDTQTSVFPVKDLEKLSPRAADFRKKQIAAYNGWLRSKSHKRGGS